jgi:low temperature requirement protein LtrA
MATWFAPLRQPVAQSQRVSTFELLFDLVFVFAFTQITEFMAHSHSARGVLQALIMLGMLWWLWSSYGWLTNQTSVDDGVLRVGMLIAMCGVFVFALAIPSAFEPGSGLNAALVIGIAYFLVRLVHVGLYLIAAGDDRALRRRNHSACMVHAPCSAAPRSTCSVTPCSGGESAVPGRSGGLPERPFSWRWCRSA